MSNNPHCEGKKQTACL